MQSKMFAVHAEADSKSELIARVKSALIELEGLAAAPAEASGKGRAAKPAAKPAAAKITVDQIKRALTSLKTAIGGDEDEDKSGIKAVKKLLKGFGVAQTPDLKEEQYEAVMAAIETAMPREDEKTDGEDF